MTPEQRQDEINARKRKTQLPHVTGALTPDFSNKVGAHPGSKRT